MTSDIQEVLARHRSQLLAHPGVVSVGIGLDEARNPVIVVGVEQETAAHPATIPKQLEGHGVVVRFVGTVRTQDE